jgi:hypothetical protein
VTFQEEPRLFAHTLTSASFHTGPAAMRSSGLGEVLLRRDLIPSLTGDAEQVCDLADACQFQRTRNSRRCAAGKPKLTWGTSPILPPVK